MIGLNGPLQKVPSRSLIRNFTISIVLHQVINLHYEKSFIVDKLIFIFLYIYLIWNLLQRTVKFLRWKSSFVLLLHQYFEWLHQHLSALAIKLGRYLNLKIWDWIFFHNSRMWNKLVNLLLYNVINWEYWHRLQSFCWALY